jgi:hypothetical protein
MAGTNQGPTDLDDSVLAPGWGALRGERAARSPRVPSFEPRQPSGAPKGSTPRPADRGEVEAGQEECRGCDALWRVRRSRHGKRPSLFLSGGYLHQARNVLGLWIDPDKPPEGARQSSGIMSQRAHFWLRIFGLAIILALQFGPRIWTSQSLLTPPRVLTAAANTR